MHYIRHMWNATIEQGNRQSPVLLKIPVDTLWHIPHFLYSCKLCFQFTTLCYLLYAPTQVKKRVKRDFNKRQNKVTKCWLQGDTNLDPLNQSEVKVHASVHRTTWVNAYSSSLKEEYIPCLWWLTVFKDDFFVLFFLISV